jgi:hypothetical protein
MNIYKKLNEIQKTLNAPKSKFNSFGKYNYRSCEDILDALKQHLGETYAVLLSDEVLEIGGRLYIRATATLTDGTESVSTTALARESETKKGMDDSQVTGSTSSYARKYALNGLFAIDDTKDADTMDNSKQVRSDKANPAQIKKIQELLEKKGRAITEVQSHYKVKTLEELKSIDASKLIARMIQLPEATLSM